MAPSREYVKQPFKRLPTSVVPSLYDIRLLPDLANLTFTGDESVQVHVKEAVNEIVLNASSLMISKAIFVDNTAGEHLGQVTLDKENQLARIKFPDTLKAGNGTLKLVFSGILWDDMKGFYRCTYTTANGEKRISASTQFETCFARRAFPCWDEPAIKAQFKVTVIGPKDRTILSNTDPISVQDYESDPSLKVVQFSPTPIMSTYLLAFVVGEYESIESKTNRGTIVRVFTPLGKIEQGTFALNTAVKSLEYFEDFFKINYPLEKIDHIAIPDFSFNAMENWGLVTYRETAIMVDPKNTSSHAMEWIASVISHETAHQWFGNLVTMEWWTHLWLNEGFATFMQYICTHKIYPQFDIWSTSVTSSTLNAFCLDSLHDTHQIEIPVGHPDEVESIFDDISYAKGGSVIKMCYSWISDDVFRAGMHDYLLTNAYKNALTENLWQALGKASKLDVGRMMSTWTLQKGHPVIHVTLKTSGNKRSLLLTQERFSYDQILDKEEAQSLWQIPISIISANHPVKPFHTGLMTEKNLEISLEDVPPNLWIKLNPEMMGFYRINYPQDLIELLKPAIAKKELKPIDRLEIVFDLYSMALAGHVRTVEFLKILNFYKDEDDYVAWRAIDISISKIDQMLSYTDCQPLFYSFCRNLYSNIYKKLGFDSSPQDSHTDTLLRVLVLHRLVCCGEKAVIEEAKKRFAAHLNGKLITPNIRGPVYLAIACYGSDQEFDKLFDLYTKEELQEEKMRLALATVGAVNPTRIQRALDFCFSADVRSQDSCRIVLGSVSSPLGRDATWKCFMKNVHEIRRRYGCNKSSALMIEQITQGFASDEKITEIEKFFSNHPFPGLENYLLRGLESIRNNQKWLAKETLPVKQYLSSITSV